MAFDGSGAAAGGLLGSPGFGAAATFAGPAGVGGLGTVAAGGGEALPGGRGFASLFESQPPLMATVDKTKAAARAAPGRAKEAAGATIGAM